jgi:DNA-directed RNA polymerase beta subunit
MYDADQPLSARLEEIIETTKLDVEGSSQLEKQFSKLLASCPLPPPLRVVDEPLDDSNRQFPGLVQPDASGTLLKKCIKYQGLTDDIIRGYNHWTEYELAEQLVSQHMTLHRNGQPYVIRLGPNVHYGEPKLRPAGGGSDAARAPPMYPHYCRQKGLTYLLDIYTDVRLTVAGSDVAIQSFTKVRLGSIPLMLRSKHCWLTGLSASQLAEVGEDTDDQGGYFVIEGVDKHILAQEQLRMNKPSVFLTPTGKVCRMITYTPARTSQTRLVIGKGGQIKYQVPVFKGLKYNKKGNVMRNASGKGMTRTRALNIFYIPMLMADLYPEELGQYISPQYFIAVIRQFLDRDIEAKALQQLLPTLAQVNTDRSMNLTPLHILQRKLPDKYKNRDHRAVAREAFDDDLFPNLNRVRNGLRLKMLQYAMMNARFLECLADVRQVDDRNAWQEKCLKNAPIMVAQLFRGALRHLLMTIQHDVIDRSSNSDKLSSNAQQIFELVAKKIRDNKEINVAFRDSFRSKWGVRGSYTKQNVVRPLTPANVVDRLSQMTKADVPIQRTDRKMGVRSVQASQTCFMCVFETPERDGIGLLKHKACTAQVTVEDIPIGALEPYLQSLSVDDANNRYPVVVNGIFRGWGDVYALREQLILKRREGEFLFLSVVLENVNQFPYLFVSMDGGRLARPLLIVGSNGLLEIDNQRRRGAEFDVLLRTGCVEYIDPWEQDTLYIATSIDVLLYDLRVREQAAERLVEAEDAYRRESQAGMQRDLQRLEEEFHAAREWVTTINEKIPPTHCELDPTALCGISAGLIPYISHNPGPRLNFQSGMNKQTLGFSSSAYRDKVGAKFKAMMQPSRPIVQTYMEDLVGLNHLATGTMVSVAILANTGYSVEDAFLLNRRSVELGLFNMIKYVEYETKLERTAEYYEMLCKPPGKENDVRYAKIGEDGLPFERTYLQQEEVIVGKVRVSSTTGEVTDQSVFIKLGGQGYVERISSSALNKTMTVRVVLRIARNPIPGDKYTTRYSLKGIVGKIVEPEDMPFGLDGTQYDLIINPHGIVGRMTMGQLLEIVASLLGVIKGERQDASAFREFDISAASRMLKERGFVGLGMKKLISGITGTMLEGMAFVGACYAQLLKHHPDDKLAMRSTTGQRRAISHQPVKGRGAQRVGEQERDVFIAHGGAFVIMDRMVKQSDGYSVQMCMRCSSFAYYDHDRQETICQLCGPGTEFQLWQTTYAAKLFQQICLGIGWLVTFQIEGVATPGMSTAQLTTMHEQGEEAEGEEGEEGEELTGGIGELEEGLDELDEDFEDYNEYEPGEAEQTDFGEG